MELNPDEVRARIDDVVSSHFEDWGYYVGDPENYAKAGALIDDLYKLFDELVNDVIEEPEEED